MTFYEQEVQRIKAIGYANQWQIDTVIGTRRYLDHHYQRALNLDLLAHVRHTSKFHLLRLFKRYYGLTPRQYLIDKRISVARDLLREGNSVREVCLAVGFTSASSFCHLFKSRTGMTPSAFAKAQLSTRESNGQSRNCA
ncbi:MAG: AraC family transcriptional regulator [Saprospiraceae bacterium]|nr:AraC family transcriptional regulator [Saprospiraceae bacterium]